MEDVFLSSVDPYRCSPEDNLQLKFATRLTAVKIFYITDTIFLVGATDKKYCDSFQQIPKNSGKVQVYKNDPSLLSLKICQVYSLELLPLNL